LTAGTGISTSGTYPNFTITNTSPSSGGTVTSVSGTTDRISSTGGNTPVIDIAGTYVGQTSITTLGTIGTGTWQGSVIGSNYGGAGAVSGLLKANGSGVVSAAVAGTDYMTPANVSGLYLPLSGGTLTGALSGTSATFKSSATASEPFRVKYSGNTNNIFELFEYASGIRAEMSLRDASANPITRFDTGGNNFINGGNLGVGTITPSAKLVVSNNNALGYEIDPTAASGTKIQTLAYDRSAAAYKDIERLALSHKFMVNGNTLALTLGSSQELTATSLAGTGTRMVEASSDGLLSATQIVTSGTYTPTLTNATNVSSATMIGTAKYQRVGNIVTVYGGISFTTGGSVSSSAIGISLPVSSNFTIGTDARGVGTGNNPAHSSSIYIVSNATNDRAEIQFDTLIASTSAFVSFSFSYEIL
jgi:hypothetical protein